MKKLLLVKSLVLVGFMSLNAQAMSPRTITPMMSTGAVGEQVSGANSQVATICNELEKGNVGRISNGVSGDGAEKSTAGSTATHSKSK